MGKVAIVTGGAGGVGSATSRVFAAQGARVVVADIDAERAEQVAKSIDPDREFAIACAVDMASESDIQAMVETAVQEFGGLDVLHNNAAATTLPLRDYAILDTDLELWTTMLTVNLIGPMLASKYAIPHMIAAGGGSIINTTSISGVAGDLAVPAYGASKAALDQLTRHIAVTYGRHGIRCNSVAPGSIEPESGEPRELLDLYARHSPLLRNAQGSEIANVVAFLASDASSYVTGQRIMADGGLLSQLPYLTDPDIPYPRKG